MKNKIDQLEELLINLYSDAKVMHESTRPINKFKDSLTGEGWIKVFKIIQKIKKVLKMKEKTTPIERLEMYFEEIVRYLIIYDMWEGVEVETSRIRKIIKKLKKEKNESREN